MYRLSFGRAITVLSISAFMIACSSGSGNSNRGGSSGTADLVPPNTLNKRIKTKAVDINQDGTIDITTTYNYDDQNRIAFRVINGIDEPTYMVTYKYQDDLLVSKASTQGDSDTHTYENGLLTGSTRSWDGDHSYQYNAQGQLIGSTGEDFFFFDECDIQLSDDPTYVPSFVINYAGNKPATVATVDGNYSVSFNYSGNRINSYSYTYNCGGAGPDSTITSDTLFSYNDDGKVTRITTNDGVFPSETEVTYDGNGRPSRLLETEPDGTTTSVMSYDEAGLITQVEINSTIKGAFFAVPDITVIYGYEDGDCVVSLSSNPANIVIAEAFTGPIGIDPHTNCGYGLDEFEF